MALHIEGSAQILLKPGAFLNPAQVFNRDISMLVGSVYAKTLKTPALWIMEPLAATGLRSIRYYKELCLPTERLVANDIDVEAVSQIKANFESNNIPGEVWHKDACDAMYSTRGKWDIVDVDPYGSAASFLDASVQAVKSGGLLCITSTDMATLCGNNPDTCFYKYQSVPSKAKYCHEFALRILLYQLNATANKYQLAVVPLISLSVDFYVRVFVKIISSAATAKLSITNTSYVFQCENCPAFYMHVLGRTSKKRNTGNLFEGHSQCPHCEGKFLLQGPIYSGKLHDKAFVNEVVQLADQKEFATKEKVKGILLNIQEELDVPLSWNVGSLCKFFKVPAMSQKNLRSAVRSIGKEISQVHTGPVHYKTTADTEEIFNIFKHWRKDRTGDKFMKGIPPDSAIHRVLTKAPTCETIDFNLEYTDHEKNLMKQTRFPMNEPNWGPGARPKKPVSEESDPVV